MTTHPPASGPLRVVTVDDEPLARDCIRLALAREPGWQIVAECRSGREAAEAIEREAPDLVFLDVQMPGMDGFGVIERVGPERMPATIFVTAFEEHALRAFQVHALDYLLKPFGDERFREALGHARRRIHGERQGELGARLQALLREVHPDAALSAMAARLPSSPYATWLTVSAQNRTQFIPVSEVDWLQADGKYVQVHAGGRTHLVRGTLAATAQRLDPAHFVRIHRGTVVNIARIREVQPWTAGDHLAILRDGTRLRVSRTFRGALLRPDL
ncbi:MAG TPA: LytTR family DNA-binding domain-containing protein [Longimicrobium sp.]|nr:LytTR family DNA-binding domain-containing protein [Longimicrobium sp.]